MWSGKQRTDFADSRVWAAYRAHDSQLYTLRQSPREHIRIIIIITRVIIEVCTCVKNDRRPVPRSRYYGVRHERDRRVTSYYNNVFASSPVYTSCSTQSSAERADRPLGRSTERTYVANYLSNICNGRYYVCVCVVTSFGFNTVCRTYEFELDAVRGNAGNERLRFSDGRAHRDVVFYVRFSTNRSGLR